MLEWLCDVQRNKIFTITFHSKVTRKAETAPRRVLSGFGNAKEPYTFCAEIQQILHKFIKVCTNATNSIPIQQILQQEQPRRIKNEMCPRIKK